jgi:hypothetical protein
MKSRNNIAKFVAAGIAGFVLAGMLMLSAVASLFAEEAGKGGLQMAQQKGPSDFFSGSEMAAQPEGQIATSGEEQSQGEEYVSSEGQETSQESGSNSEYPTSGELTRDQRDDLIHDAVSTHLSNSVVYSP